MKTRTASTAARAAAAVLLTAALASCGTMTPDAGPPADSKPATAAAPATSTTTATSDPSEAAPLPTGSGGTPRPGLPKNVDTSSADAVGRAALTVMWTMDTTIDTSQYDATMRAAPYLTTKYAAQLKAAPPRSAPGAEWTTWTQHKAWTTVALESADEAGRPSDTPTDAYRTWTVTTTPHGTDRWTGDPTVTTAFVSLTRSGGAWKVSAVQVQ